MRSLLLPVVALAVLAGCAGQFHYLSGTPLRDLMPHIEPGTTTRTEVHSLLGTPWYSVAARRAELYAGNSEFQEFISFGLPVPAGKSHERATLLVVYDTSDLVSGVEYFGAGKNSQCPDLCLKGDLQGLQIEPLHTLLAPARDGEAAAWVPDPDHCLLVVDATRARFAGRRAGLYLDEIFLERVPQSAPGYFRVAVEPGDHSLSCRTEGLKPEGLPVPGHRLPAPGTWPESLESARFACAAGEYRYFRLLNTGGRWFRPVRCAPEPLEGLTLPRDARQVIVPDVAAGRDN